MTGRQQVSLFLLALSRCTGFVRKWWKTGKATGWLPYIVWASIPEQLQEEELPTPAEELQELLLSGSRECSSQVLTFIFSKPLLLQMNQMLANPCSSPLLYSSSCACTEQTQLSLMTGLQTWQKAVQAAWRRPASQVFLLVIQSWITMEVPGQSTRRQKDTFRGPAA